MFANHTSPIIISVGGSLIVPEKIDVEFLSNLSAFIRKHIKKGKRFCLTTGGGKSCRHYQAAASSVNPDMQEIDIDWLGIHATRLNGQLLRTIFVDIAHPRMIENYEHKLENWTEPLVIGAGSNPGHSTDYNGVVLARDYGGQLMIKLTSVEGIYDKNPKEDASAKPISKLTWKEYSKIIGTTWTPGLNTPFDPVAAQLAGKVGLKVVVAKGHDFKNLEKIIEGKDFIGTVIEP